MTILGSSVHTVTRRDAGSYSGTGISDGLWVDGTESTFTIQLSVQPLRPHELELLPQGESAKEALKCYAPKSPELRTVEVSGKTRCDLVEVNGRNYEVHSVSGFDDHVLNHRKYVLVRSTLGSES